MVNRLSVPRSTSMSQRLFCSAVRVVARDDQPAAIGRQIEVAVESRRSDSPQQAAPPDRTRRTAFCPHRRSSSRRSRSRRSRTWSRRRDPSETEDSRRWETVRRLSGAARRRRGAPAIAARARRSGTRTSTPPRSRRSAGARPDPDRSGWRRRRCWRSAPFPAPGRGSAHRPAGTTDADELRSSRRARSSSAGSRLRPRLPRDAAHRRSPARR